MFELGMRAFTTFFATVSPIDVAAFYAVLAAGYDDRQRQRMAIKSVIIATALLLVFTLAGGPLLSVLGITLPAMQTAGGILLLLLAIVMVLARRSSMSSPNPAESDEAGGRADSHADISVFPMATPLIAGPAAIGAAVLMAAEAGSAIDRRMIVIIALVAVMTIQLVILLVASRLHAWLGVTGQNVIARVVGILLAALAIQFMFDGISASGLIASGAPRGAGG
jgi:multiple antibiotic resistance protein